MGFLQSSVGKLQLYVYIYIYILYGLWARNTRFMYSSTRFMYSSTRFMYSSTRLMSSCEMYRILKYINIHIFVNI